MAATHRLRRWTLAFSLQLPSTQAFWGWLILGNLTTLLAWRTLA